MACWLFGLPTYTDNSRFVPGLIQDETVNARRDLVEFDSNGIRNYHLAGQR
jgi:hypothetical protein